ncbi:MAG: hypothetical protein QOE70_3342 [Chthoniobacter sp.]|jgi:arsenate reductase|nr:hypothetical protein [Chthoniobacter sp.]
MIPERIRKLLEAEPFIPFSVFLIDRHSIHIGHPATAALEDDGRALVVQTMVRGEIFVETVDTAAITRLLVKTLAPTTEIRVSENAPIPGPAQPVGPGKTRVLFICTRNSARSQMAQAWLNHLGGEQMEAESAGFEPGELHPLAVEAMREVGIEIAEQKTKSIFDLYRSGALFAFTICVCDESAEKPPVFPGPTKRLHWSLPDPLAGGGSDADVLSGMRAARDALRARIEAWVSATTADGTLSS